MKHLVFLFITCLFFAVPVFAQNTAKPDSFTTNAMAQDAQTLLTNRYRVLLWGIEAAHIKGSPLSLRGRSALDDLIADGVVRCQVASWRGEQPVARCVNSQNVDLGATMVQNGFAVVNRQSVIGSAYEEPYITAEKTAKAQKKGIWSDKITENAAPQMSFADLESMMPMLSVIGGIVFFFFLITSLMMMSGFKKVETLVKKSMALTRAQEERMRKREKFVVAGMLEGELLANKGKIEAFVVINRDVLSGLNAAKNNNTLHKYQQSTEILQKNPILMRAVFDGNTDKLELLGTQFAKDIVELYNDVSAEVDYLTLEKNLPIEDAITHTQKIILEAERMLDPIDKLLGGLQIILSDRRRQHVPGLKNSDTLDID